MTDETLYPAAWRYKCSHDGHYVFMEKRLTDGDKARGYYTGEDGEDEVDGDEAITGPFYWSDEMPLYEAGNATSAPPPISQQQMAVEAELLFLLTPWAFEPEQS